MPIRAMKEFINLESASGIILLFMAILALVIDNSPLSHAYTALFNAVITFHVNGYTFTSAPLTVWINDGLMTLFFLLVGLEIKREMLVGELNSHTKIALPAIAAIGGMLLPAIIYILFNFYGGISLRGWAIPTATDIAFALGILALLGSRVPVGLKVFLTALAIFDDIGAIIIIGAFYTSYINWLALGLAAICIVILWMLHRYKVKNLTPYMIAGVILWGCMLLSGVHAVIAGVLLAFAIPLGEHDQSLQHSPLRRLEHRLHPWVAYGILPLFGFANAGVSFAGVGAQHLLNNITLGVALGLFLGKQFGVLGAVWLAVKSKIVPMPDGANWLNFYGVAVLCGVGFTMSLFIGGLAFEEIADQYIPMVRMGVLGGSLLSGFLGYFILHYSYKRNARNEFN